MDAHSKQFTQIYTDFYKLVYYFVFQKIGSKEIAEDITQETFLTAYKSWKEIPDKDSCRNFLYIIARNRMIDYWRSAHNKYSVLPEVKEEGESFFDTFSASEKLQEDWFVETENSKKALQILNNLPEKDREILLVKFLQEMSYKEISSVYNISEESARKRVERALKKARNI
jgi:RNA polymerase sigma-70 factor (ECF subfamily)